ncbi:MAG: FAD-dependent oxidoreductase, partial [Kiritimatiellales bacterium]|nr:FAD-dependent oxidoreductase [Kiritimatiellales bacterium]
AYKLPPNPEFGRSVDSPNGQWWLEYPNDMDDLWHAEEARDELLRIIFGYWDFIKNKWQYKYSVENAALTYVPVTEAKRESRRLLGDHVLTQNDVLAARAFPDTIGHAGWSMDIHHPEGILSGRGGPYDFDRFAPQSNIPFSSLYSRNIENLLFAGRCISVTHVALGTVRVEGSCAVTGQAVGTAAAMCAAKNTTPRELDARYIGELQQQLLKDDQYVPGIRNQDADDLALHASVSASSVAAGDQTDQAFVLPDRSGRSLGMYTLYGLVYPTGSDGRIGDLYLRVFSSLEKEVSLPIKIRAVENNRVTDVAACPVLQEATVRVPELHDGYVKFSLQCAVPSPFFMVEINASPGLFLPWAKKGHLGTRLVWERNGISNIGRPAVMMYTDPPLQYPNDYSAANVIGGISRIEDAESNMWRSDPSAPLPQWLALKWDAPQKISSIHLTFDTDLDVWNHDEAMPPETVKAYDVQVNTPDGWKTVVSEANNFQRFRKHTIEPVMTDQLRVVVNRTGGDPSARIYEIRVY